MKINLGTYNIVKMEYYEKIKFFKFITNRALLFCTCCCLRNCIKFSMSKHVKNITNNQFLQLFSTLEPSGCVQHNVRHDIIIFFNRRLICIFCKFSLFTLKSLKLATEFYTKFYEFYKVWTVCVIVFATTQTRHSCLF